MGQGADAARGDLAALRDLTVLFADDDGETADSMAAILGRYFAKVVIACDGVQALQRFDLAEPDVVLLDIGMPEVNGLDVAKQLRARDADIPIAILTCHDDREHLLGAVPLGLTDYLLKPVTTTGLRKLLKRCLVQLELRGRLRHAFPGGVIYYPATRTLRVADGELPLSRNEQRFLDYMLAHRGRLMPTDRICCSLSDDYHEPLSVQGLRNLVHRLRGKIGHDAVLSERDMGYRVP